MLYNQGQEIYLLIYQIKSNNKFINLLIKFYRIYLLNIKITKIWKKIGKKG